MTTEDTNSTNSKEVSSREALPEVSDFRERNRVQIDPAVVGPPLSVDIRAPKPTTFDFVVINVDEMVPQAKAIQEDNPDLKIYALKIRRGGLWYRVSIAQLNEWLNSIEGTTL